MLSLILVLKPSASSAARSSGLLGAALLGLAPHLLPTYYRSLALAVLTDVALGLVGLLLGPTRYLSLATGAFFGRRRLHHRGGDGAPPMAATRRGRRRRRDVRSSAPRAPVRGPYFAIFTFGLAEGQAHALIWYETPASPAPSAASCWARPTR